MGLNAQHICLPFDPLSSFLPPKITHTEANTSINTNTKVHTKKVRISSWNSGKKGIKKENRLHAIKENRTEKGPRTPFFSRLGYAPPPESEIDFGNLKLKKRRNS